MAGLVPLTPTHNNPLPSFHNLSFSRCSVPPHTKAKIIPLCSPSSSSSLVQDPSPPSSDQTQDEALSGEEAKTIPPSRGCKACGREELEKGCNGEGRIQGGIATVPGFGWWPIKAFRPCPGFVASGGRYKRRGQSMDEVAGGRRDRIGAMASAREAQSSKEKQSPRRFKG